MKTITGNVSAWLSTPDSLRFQDKSDPASYTYTAIDNDMTAYGWVKIGTAHITLDALDDQEIAAGEIAILKDAKRKLQAETEAKLTVIEERIQSLLALPAPV